MAKKVKSSEGNTEKSVAKRAFAIVDEVPASTRKNSSLGQFAAAVKENDGKVLSTEYGSAHSASTAGRALREKHGLYACVRGNTLYVSTDESAIPARKAVDE